MGYDPMPIKKAIALDPWLEPIPVPTKKHDVRSDISPLLVINAPGFTVWSNHFRRLLGMVKEMDSSLMTVLGGNREFNL